MELREAGVASEGKKWLLWVDDKIWGYTEQLEEAKNSLLQIAESIKGDLEKEHPTWRVEYVVVDERVKVKCINLGYIYNSKWLAHSLRYEAINKFAPRVPKPPVPPPVENRATRRRRRRN